MSEPSEWAKKEANNLIIASQKQLDGDTFTTVQEAFASTLREIARRTARALDAALAVQQGSFSCPCCMERAMFPELWKQHHQHLPAAEAAAKDGKTP